MAGHGPAPKAPEKRHRGARGASTTSLASDGQLRGNPLPRSGYSVREDGESHAMAWPEQTKTWWLNWRKSAQAQTFTASDWDFLLETAVLHARFWSGDHSVSGELRLRVAKFGATPEDRLRLKIEITPDEGAEAPSKATPSGVADLNNYRRLAAGNE